MQPIAFVSPFTNTENPYIARQREQLGELGFDVRPLSLRALATGRCAGLARRENVVVVSWLETRLWRASPHGKRLSLTGAAEFGALTLTLALARARVVYVVHNHDAHDVRPAFQGLSTWSVRTLRRLADARVVHDPSFADRYRATYVPHPLYRVPPQPARASARATPSFVALGAIRRYKALDALLEQWPSGVPLTIAGKADDAYLTELHAILERRGLSDCVSIDARFLTDDEFEQALAAHDVLVLPHRAEANLVSGAFFAGVGVVRVILARRTPFIAWAQEHLAGVRSFREDAQIAGEVLRILDDWPSLRSLDQSAAAVAQFGDEPCLSAWTQVLTTAGAPPPRPRRTMSPIPSANRG
ncbi:hypothetical protein [Demequina activiva]|uniref:Uncharacterized protein n=1 Tax=Demequina activiva TaxID=1582364 RepID=A0A919Q1A2_9MICO|nr:hypothetical protein [Demequina activiva]GIG53432.1 hypothetical protein Dac01nite_01840 [Demequina activiva]